jgi:hypothetical protein
MSVRDCQRKVSMAEGNPKNAIAGRKSGTDNRRAPYKVLLRGTALHFDRNALVHRKDLIGRNKQSP